MTAFPTPLVPSANDGAPRQPHCGTGASAPCACLGCRQQRVGGEAAMQAGSTPVALCHCAACNCA